MPTTTAPDVAVLISFNDLEATAIKARCEQAGYRVIPLKRDWGRQTVPALAEIDVDSLPRTVILVETADPEFEERLRRSGRLVYLIDHHLYLRAGAPPLDRRNPRSSLEQIVDLLGLAPLAPEECCISINDRAFWPGLLRYFEQQASKTGAGQTPRDAAWAVRQREINVRAESLGRPIPSLDETLNWLKDGFDQSAARVIDTCRGTASEERLILLHAPLLYAPILMDAVWFDHAGRIAQNREKDDCHEKPDAPRLEILAVFHEKDQPKNLARVEYSGPADRVPFLDEVFTEIGRPGGASARLSYWGGSGDKTAFLGADRGPEGDIDALSDLADRLLDAMLAGNRPLTRWRTRFFQILDASKFKLPSTGLDASEIELAPIRSDAAEMFVPAPPPPEPTDEEGKREEPEEVKKRRREFEQERAYFFPHLQRFIAPRRNGDPASRSGEVEGEREVGVELLKPGSRLNLDDLAIRSWRLVEPDMSITVESQQEPAFRLREKVHSVVVHLAYGRLVVLEWTFGGDPFLDKYGPLWQRLLKAPAASAEEPRRVHTLANLLDFNFAARMCRSPYRDPSNKRVIELRLGKRWSGVNLPTNVRYRFGDEVDVDQAALSGWFALMARAVLEPLGFSDITKLKLVFDERARAVVAATGVGRTPPSGAARERFNNMLARFAGLDNYGPDYFYAQAFTQRELAAWLYDRFAPMSLYYATSHSLAYWGEEGEFAEDVIADFHMPTMYRRMFLVVLLYSATFDVLAHRLGEWSRKRLSLEHALQEKVREFDEDPSLHAFAARERKERKLDRVAEETSRIKTEMNAFANALWFETVSPQIQGDELFRKMTSQVPVKAHYEELMREVERTEQLERQDADRRQEERRRVLQTVVVFAATLTLVFTFAAAKMFPFDADRSSLCWAFVLLLIAVAISFGTTVAYVALTEGRGVRNAFRRLCVHVFDYGATVTLPCWRARKKPTDEADR